MKQTALTLLLLVSWASWGAYAVGPEQSPFGFDAFLRTWEKAQNLFINGDAAAWTRNVSPKSDATIFGAFGGYETGADVGPRFDWAASQYENSGAAKRIEYLSRLVGDRLAVTVSIERDRARVKGRDEPIDQALRVTQVFRWEDGSWKLVHRHADPLMEKKAPSRG